MRLLAPFDPVVWDRRRFEIFWAWAYRFEAYTPVAKRVRGHYALPLLWRDQVIGWGTVAVRGDKLPVDLGYVSVRRRARLALVRRWKMVGAAAHFLALAPTGEFLRQRPTNCAGCFAKKASMPILKSSV